MVEKNSALLQRPPASRYDQSKQLQYKNDANRFVNPVQAEVALKRREFIRHAIIFGTLIQGYDLQEKCRGAERTLVL